MKIFLYLEPGCNLCMGNQEKAAKGDTMATPRVSFQGRVVEDSEGKKGESLLHHQLWYSLPF
jgi:aconitate hydratase 2/2-methylisocitrate dehydratase